MEDIGAEVSLKIRSAIKAKLVELGAYVDDELPDYIMVMVANKRSKTQMDNDLKLFLGSNTITFTTWLHTVLQKLQEVTIASNLSKQNAQPVPEKQPIKSSKTSSPVDGEDHKHKHKKKQKKSSESTSKRKSADSKKAVKGTEGKVTAYKTSDLTETVDSIKVKDGDKISTSNGKSKDLAKTSKKDLAKSIIALEAEIEEKQKLVSRQEIKNSIESDEIQAGTKSVGSNLMSESHKVSEKPSYELVKKSLHTDVVMETAPPTKVVYSSPVSSPVKIRKPIMMQSDEEDFEDIINIKDTEMMDFLDAELPDELPKITRTIVLSPKTASSQPKPTVSVKTVSEDPDMEVDDLEEQRAKLLRDLNRLGKPVKSSRPTVDKYSVAKLLDRHSKPSALNRLGAVVDESRLNLIDPDEFNIDGPPKEAEAPKPKMADRLGKKPVVESEKAITKRSSLNTDRNVASMKVPSESTLVSRDSTKDDSRRNVMDRLGKRNSPGSDDEQKDLRGRSGSFSRKEKSVLVASNDKKVPKEPERRVNVMDRLGTRPGHSSASERTKRVLENESLKSKLGDRVGKVRSSSKERTSEGRSHLQHEKRASPERETFKSRFIDRLGKKESRSMREEDESKSVGRKETALTKEPERMTIMDRLGKKVTRERTEVPERDASSKRPTRVISIKEALAGELHHSGGKRAKTNIEEKEREELPRKRPLLSRVVAVKRDPRANEEADPDVAVASVIRVQPRPRVPAAMQANKNLLLKAMAEAQKSVAAAPVRQEAKHEPDHKDFLYTRKYRDVAPEKINITLANPKQELDQDEELVEEEEEEEDEEMAKINRTVANVNQRLKLAAARSNSQRTEEEVTGGGSQRQKKATAKAANEKADTKQITEVLQPIPPPAKQHAAAHETAVSMVEEEDDDDEVLEEIYEEDEGDSVVGNVSPLEYIEEEGEEYVPPRVSSTEDEPELQHNYNIKRSGRAGNTQFVVTLDGLDPLTMFNTRKRTVEQQHTERPASPLPVPEHESRIHNWLLSLERAKEEKERTASPVVYKKPRLASTVEVAAAAVPTGKPLPPVKASTVERCKYWPACRQGEHCEFAHPTMPCKSFPSCKFGDKCLYVHPNCKFATSCTRRDCPYTHTGVRPTTGPVQAVLPLSRARNPHAQPVCKFYPKCSNVNCAFQHPMPCRFGRSCTKSDCVFYHEDIPSTEKLKWVKTN